MKFFIAVTASLVMAIMALCQNAIEFEAVSVRPNLNGGENTQVNLRDPGRFAATNASLKTLIRNAFGIAAAQISGGPAWLDADRYDIVATTGRAGQISQDQLKPLLQSLLAERFHFRFHRETREFPVYALVVAKNGPKLMENRGASGPSFNTRKTAGYALMTCTNVTMVELVRNLGPLDRIVIDETGLKGRFDLTLEWSPDQTIDTAGVSIFTAVQEQLGLKLEAEKGPVEVVVIDQADRASEN